VLAEHGYEPAVGEQCDIALANCPFHRLAQEHRDLVCGMNLDLLDGVIDGIGASGTLAARLEPVPGWCCVRISPQGRNGDDAPRPAAETLDEGGEAPCYAHLLDDDATGLAD
jgi:hypothetical protein